jgi:3-methylcrotonyl-CoA carboxylase alpha subunit
VRIDEESFMVEIVAQPAGDLVLRFGPRIERFLIGMAGAAIRVQWRGTAYQLHRQDAVSVDDLGDSAVSAHGTANLEAPMSGTIVKVLVEEGQAVAAGEALMVLEAMKMEHTITAPSAGTVSRIHFRAGQLAPGGAMLIEIV